MTWFDDFNQGKVRQIERLSNSSGVGMLQLVFKARFYPRRAEKPRIKQMMHTSIVELAGLEITNGIKLATKN